eukprot:COSAG01_NODE_1035_length_11997_cov_95.509665_2_plen_91_part_00
MRWLSGPNNPPKCGALCTTDTGNCKQDSKYKPGSDYDYWIPLEFNNAGQVQQFAPFVDEFNLTLSSTLKTDDVARAYHSIRGQAVAADGS